MLWDAPSSQHYLPTPGWREENQGEISSGSPNYNPKCTLDHPDLGDSDWEFKEEDYDNDEDCDYISEAAAESGWNGKS